MKNKHILITAILVFVIPHLILIIKLMDISKTPVTANTIAIEKYSEIEKRGNPSYDYIIGKDGLPHFRVFFWVAKDANIYIPYADKGVITNVSHHGPVEKWSVIETNEVNGDEKLVFIFVPKTFVFLFGDNFDKVIHLDYSISNKFT